MGGLGGSWRGVESRYLSSNFFIVMQGALLSQFLPQPLRLASVTVSLPAAAAQPLDAASSAGAAGAAAGPSSAGGPGAAPAAADVDAAEAAAAGDARAAVANAASAASSCRMPPAAAVTQAVRRALHSRIAPMLAADAPTGLSGACHMQHPPLAVHVVPAAPPMLGLEPSPTRQSPSGVPMPLSAPCNHAVQICCSRQLLQSAAVIR